MKLFKVHYFDHVLNHGKIQHIYAKDIEQAADKWQGMRLSTQETIIEISEADMIITFKEQEIESFPDAEGVSNILSELKDQSYGSYDWIEEDYTTSFGRVDGKPALTIGIKVTELEGRRS